MCLLSDFLFGNPNTSLAAISELGHPVSRRHGLGTGEPSECYRLGGSFQQSRSPMCLSQGTSAGLVGRVCVIDFHYDRRSSGSSYRAITAAEVGVISIPRPARCARINPRTDSSPIATSRCVVGHQHYAVGVIDKLLDPPLHLAIGGIAEHANAAPILRQPVIFLCEIPGCCYPPDAASGCRHVEFELYPKDL